VTGTDDSVRVADVQDGIRRHHYRLHRIDWTYELVFLVVVLGAAALALSLAGRRPGWSIGQTPPDPLLVQIYAAHFRHGDFYPVWSSSDAYGMGTPVLLFYQRAFFTVGGLVFIVLGGALKPTLVVTVGIFMVIGAYGMRKALSLVTESRLLVVVGSAGFLLSNWTFSEWLTRADLAEFSALMLVPWLIFWCLTLIRDRRWSWSIVPVIVGLVWAHNTVALLAIILLAVTAVAFLACYRLAGLRAVAFRLVVSVGLTGLILAPGLLAEVKMGKYYDPATAITNYNAFVSSFTFVKPWAVLFNPTYHWLSRTNNIKNNPFDLDLQIDVGVTLLLLLGLFTALVLWIRKHVERAAPEVPNVNRVAVTVLVVSFAIYQLMQFRFSLSVWTAFWQLKVLGYPFRMMTFSIPLAFVLAAVVADWYLRLYRSRRPKLSWRLPATIAALWLVLLVVLSPIAAREPAPLAAIYPYAPFAPIDVLTEPKVTTFDTNPLGPLFAEYLPKVDSSNGHALEFEFPLYERLHRNHTEATSLSSVHCTVTQTTGTQFESLEATYRVACAGPTRLALPISFNPYTTVTERTTGSRSAPIAVLHAPTDPRIIINVSTEGTHSFTVHLPTLSGILF
jgi:hypothetical protein